jgi:hypothetical protein
LFAGQDVLEHAQSAKATVHALDNFVQAQLSIGPERLDSLGILHTHSDEATLAGPVRSALDAKLLPDALERLNEVVAEHLVVARCRGDAQALLADGDSRVVDGLDVNLVLLEKEIRGALSDLSITNENGDDVRRVGDDWDVTLCKSRLDSTCVQLLQATVATVGHLVFDSGLSTSHGGRWERGGEDEAGCQPA